MKRLFFIIVIVTLPIIAFFEFQGYRRFHPPSMYTYETPDEIDLAYHDKAVLAGYYQDVTELERLGRYTWKTYRVDVSADQPQESPEKDLVEAYKQLKAKILAAEDMLKRSYQLKEKGHDAEAVESMIEKGISEEEYRAQKFLNGKAFLQFDEQGESIYELQKILEQKGYDLPVDGYFERKTLNAVKAFQDSVGIFPTGRVGDLTVKKLLEQ